MTFKLHVTENPWTLSIHVLELNGVLKSRSFADLSAQLYQRTDAERTYRVTDEKETVVGHVSRTKWSAL